MGNVGASAAALGEKLGSDSGNQPNWQRTPPQKSNPAKSLTTRAKAG